MLIVWAMLLQQDAAMSATRMVLALMLVVLASSLALGICFGLMRRIQAISPPKKSDPQINTKTDE